MDWFYFQRITIKVRNGCELSKISMCDALISTNLGRSPIITQSNFDYLHNHKYSSRGESIGRYKKQNAKFEKVFVQQRNVAKQKQIFFLISPY
jgi:hypothetical protein